MDRWLKILFFTLIVRPLVFLILGLNVRHRERLPRQGPAVLVANHNSHLDTLVLMSLYPWRQLPSLRPVAAGDYFLRNPFMAWFATRVIGIIPLQRQVQGHEQNPLEPIRQALDAGEIVILYPEGSRGEPEHIAEFKNGVAHLAKGRPQVPVYPIFLHGLGKALPKGEALLVPFFCDVFIGEAIYWNQDRRLYMESLRQSLESLAGEGQFSVWK